MQQDVMSSLLTEKLALVLKGPALREPSRVQQILISANSLHASPQAQHMCVNE